jgi:hypothetical protein
VPVLLPELLQRVPKLPVRLRLRLRPERRQQAQRLPRQRRWQSGLPLREPTRQERMQEHRPRRTAGKSP